MLEVVQDMLLRLALQMARDDYEDRRERQRQGIEVAKATGRYAGRNADIVTHDRIVALRAAGHSRADPATSWLDQRKPGETDLGATSADVRITLSVA